MPRIIPILMAVGSLFVLLGTGGMAAARPCGLPGLLAGQKWLNCHDYDIDQLDHAKCTHYGAAPGTPAYVQCRAQLDAARTTAPR
jgi:hypothetical protein